MSTPIHEPRIEATVNQEPEDISVHIVTARWPVGGATKLVRKHYHATDLTEMHQHVDELRKAGWTKIRIHRLTA